ncbi:MAG TPA: ABC transporter permease [Mycobacteriales bacterium]|nr:ABC transporter permease [Mycobacteriales bacterium]
MSVVEAPAVAARVPATRPISSRFLRSELRMVFGRRRNQIALLVLSIVPIVIGIAVKVTEPADGGTQQFITQITQNGGFLAFSALTIVLPVFLPLAISVIAGDAVAGEASSGTLRYLLVVPVDRTRMLVVKYATILIFTLTAAVSIAAVGLIFGLILFPHGEATLLSGTAVGMGNLIGRLALTVLYVTVCMAALGAIGLFVSTLVESAVAAMASAAGLTIIAQVLISIPQLHSIHPYLFNHYWLDFGDLLRSPMQTDNVIQGGLVALAYVAVFGSAAWARFTTKDVSS